MLFRTNKSNRSSATTCASSLSFRTRKAFQLQHQHDEEFKRFFGTLEGFPSSTTCNIEAKRGGGFKDITRSDSRHCTSPTYHRYSPWHREYPLRQPALLTH